MDIKTIEYLANLARLDIAPDEKESLVKDLGGVLAYVDQIQSVAKNLDVLDSEYLKTNTASNDESRHVGGQYSEAILAGAPMREGEYVVVKKVL